MDSTQTFKNIHLASGSAELAHQGEKPIDFTVLILPPFQLSNNEGKIFLKKLNSSRFDILAANHHATF